MKVPLLDLKAQFVSIEPEIRAAIDRVLASQHFILGEEVSALESEVARYVGCRHGIGVSSGSDALLVGLMVLGVGPGDEVVTSPHTFFATVGAITRLGAKPVFVDIEPKSFNLDSSLLARAISAKTKAVIPVHLFGQAAEMAPVMAAVRGKGIAVFEDAAQSIGTEYQGQRVSSIGTMSCLSFFPSKNLGAMGDGGMVTTNDEATAEKLRVYRSHGSKPKYVHKFIGGNFRLDALQAAILRAKFPHLDAWTAGRQKNAAMYDERLGRPDLAEFVTIPWRRPGDRHIFNQYVVRVRRRDELKAHLEKNGIGTEVYYPVPMHLQECFAYLGHRKGDFPEAEKAAADSLALPVYPELSPQQIAYVADAVRAFYLK